jgi:metal-sulfur cluster biosynthetic enzyme
MYQNLMADIPANIDKAAILDALGRVLDPELDEPILQLGFVQSLSVDDHHAIITLQLPTSWCAINFAFIMAEDARAALLGVDGIKQVTVRVGDHASAEEIEAAVNNGKPFSAAFPGEGGLGLAALQGVFLRKGFLVRQERLLRELRDAGLSAALISALRIGKQSVASDALHRYLQRRAELGLDCSPEAPLIVDQTGAPIATEQLEDHYQRIRTVRVSLEANGSFCRAVLATRRAAPAISGQQGNDHVQS